MTSLTRQKKKKKKNLQTFKFCSSKTKINCSEMNNCFQKFLTFWFLLKSNDKIRLNEASGKLQTSSTIFFLCVFRYSFFAEWLVSLVPQTMWLVCNDNSEEKRALASKKNHKRKTKLKLTASQEVIMQFFQDAKWFDIKIFGQEIAMKIAPKFSFMAKKLKCAKNHE